ncbi:MAG: type I secretion system permease/ATPase [Hyphomicrobiaceae bacterium]
MSSGRASVASPILEILSTCRSAFVSIAITSGIVNILTLTGSLFMLQVYDRVLNSHSIPTLLVLSLLALVAYAFQGGLDYIRSRMLALVGERLDEELGARIHRIVVTMPLRNPQGAVENLQPLRDLDAMRTFMSSQGPVALFDMPWAPVYLALCFVFHPIIGLVALGGAVVLVGFTAVSEIRGAKPMKDAVEAISQRNHQAESAQRGAEVLQAMGMLGAVSQRWQEVNGRSLALQRQANFMVGSLSAAAKTFRMILQSLLLGVAAYLAIKNEISAGTIIAATILGSKVVAPVDLAIASWKAYAAARQGYDRLNRLFGFFPAEEERFALPAPKKTLEVQELAVVAPGANAPIVQRIGFKAEAGQAVGIIGPSASGKSTIARALVGVWPAARGDILLDGASIKQWNSEALGPSIGYLPQDVQLFEGTIAENIARFRPDASTEAVIRAATAACFHEHALGFPKGYDTPVGKGGSHLSAGQRQRLGLARALYGDPFLVVLDEPNANLDAEGEAAVTTAIRNVRARGGIAVVIAHRPSAIAAVDLLLVLRNGQPVAFGPRDEVLAKTVQSTRPGGPGPGGGAPPSRAVAGRADASTLKVVSPEAAAGGAA